jgi:hypothetical protein
MFFICKEKEKHGDGIPCEINAASYQIKWSKPKLFQIFFLFVF